MKNKGYQDLYTDYLICNMGYATATGLSKVVGEDNLSHDKVSRFLSSLVGGSKALWSEVKPLIRKLEGSEPGFLIIDDTIEEKPYTDENELVNWHYSHSKGRIIKGINILSALIRYGDIALPVDYHVVTKDEAYIDKAGKSGFKSSISKNEIARKFISQAKANNILFEYVLADIWFSSDESMKHVNAMGKKFIFGCKSNRLVKFNKIWHRLDALPMADEQVITCYIKGLDFPVAITKKVFINEDLSTGVLYLISNDLNSSGNDLYKLYQKRWIIEDYHKSIKQNTSLTKSPTKIMKTQSNHIYCSILAFIKLEMLKIKTSMNHFALKSRLFINATRAALEQLQKFRLAGNTYNA